MRILVATDGSEHSDEAVRLVAGMAWPEGTTFRVVSAVDDPVAGFDVAPNDLIQDELRRQLEGPVAQAAAVLGGTPVDRAVLRGRAAPAILEDAAVYGADLIVVGHRGRGPVAALLLGSVATEVVERAKVPVLVARSSSRGPIILADDDSEPARAARRIVATWPALAGSTVRVVSVAQVTAPLASGISPTVRRAAATAHAGELGADLAQHSAVADATARDLRARGIHATASASTGDPATAILAAAAETHAQLIVVGSRGRGGVASLLGSVARAVVLRAACSVLVVHGP
jgi:nucleotide-binding universal stress UspA family protein